MSVSLANGFQVGMLVVKCPDRHSIKTLLLSFQFQIEVDYLGLVAKKTVFGVSDKVRFTQVFPVTWMD